MKLVLFLAIVCAAAATSFKAPGMCSMYGVCNGNGATCPYNGPAKKLSSDAETELVQLCGKQFADTNVCCDGQQIAALKINTIKAYAFLGSCRACWRNFLDFFCEFTCSPNQSTFLDVTKVSDTPKQFVTEVEYSIDPSFGEGFFESCRSVKFGADNSFAMMIFDNPTDYHGLFKTLGTKGQGRSPFQINFPVPVDNDTSMSIVPQKCHEGDLKCVCLDCDKTCPVLEQPKFKRCSILGIQCSQILALILFVSIFVATATFVFIKWFQRYRLINTGLPQEATALLDGLESSSVETDTRTERGRTFTSYETEVSAQPSFNVFFSQQYFNYPVNSWLEKRFYALGLNVSRKPGPTLIVALVVVLAFSFGLFFLQVETDPVNLWAEPGSRVALEKQFFDTNFGPFFRTEQVIITSSNNSSPISKENLRLVFSIVEQIQKFSVTLGAKKYSFEDLCFQPLKDGNCVIQSAAAYWKNNLAEFEAETNYKQKLESCLKSPTGCLPPYMQPLKPEFALGGYEENSYMDAKALIITVVMQNYNDDFMKGIVETWEKSFVTYLKDVQEIATLRNLNVSFSAELSIEQELARESAADIPTVGLSYLVMFLYASLALGKLSLSKNAFIESRFGLGLCGIIVVIASVSSAAGIFSWMGKKVTLIIAEVIPFLVLAIGVDNIFILVHAVERETLESIPPISTAEIITGESSNFLQAGRRPTLSAEVRVARALSRMGPSILLAAVTETFAFSLGSLVGLPAVKSFAIMAAISVFINFLLQITVFVSLLCWDTKRREQGRLDLIPCIQLTTELKFKESFLQGVFKFYYGPALLHPLSKIFLSSIFVVAFLFSVVTMNKIKLGLDQRIALPTDSYLIGYFDNLEKYFKVGPPLYWVVQGDDPSTTEGQAAICSRVLGCSELSLTQILEQERKRPNISFISQPTASWIDDFYTWLDPSSVCCRYDTSSSPQTFCDPEDWDDDKCQPCIEDGRDSRSLKDLPKSEEFEKLITQFLSMNPSPDCPVGGAAGYGTALKFDLTKNNTITASHFRTFHSVLKSQSDFISAYEAARRIATDIEQENPGLKVYPYSIFYIFFDQYLNIEEQALSLVGLGLLAIFFTTTLFIGSFKLAAIVTMIVTMITTDLVAVMYLWDIQLNAITLVNIIICTGISVEFCSHITRAFSVTSHRHAMFLDGILMAGSRNRRVLISLVEVGSSVFSGITVTKFLGIFILAFAQSKIFEIYYFRMYISIVVLAFLHGLMFLPIVLSWLGDSHVVRTGTFWLEREGQLAGDNRPYSMYAEIVDQVFDE